MSVKRLLGLEKTNVTDEEITRGIQEAQKGNTEVLEFLSAGNTVRVTVKELEPLGMIGYWNYGR
jgi:hypothetical protein